MNQSNHLLKNLGSWIILIHLLHSAGLASFEARKANDQQSRIALGRYTSPRKELKPWMYGSLTVADSDESWIVVMVNEGLTRLVNCDD